MEIHFTGYCPCDTIAEKGAVAPPALLAVFGEEQQVELYHPEWHDT